MLFDTLTIVGVGLIGGSIGLAARQRKLARRVFGVCRSDAAMARAISAAAIDSGFTSCDAAVSESDLIIFCTPVDQIAAGILSAALHCRPGTIITDTGSTKSAIVRAVETAMPSGVPFVGGHPLAGSEKNGVEHADARLFQDRVTVLTPTQCTDAGALQRVSDFWMHLGARACTMSPEDHDRAMALTSHLPHLLAAALAGVLPEELRGLAASGFRDTTRIAAGDPSLWTPILSQNRGAVLDAITAFKDRLDLFQQALHNDEGGQLSTLLDEGKRRRDALGS
jgi:prephenate dehydrogenase